MRKGIQEAKAITNDDYCVTAAGGYSGVGQVGVVTRVGYQVLLPLVLRH